MNTNNTPGQLKVVRQQRDDEQPEHRNDRRRFLIWALMLNLVPPERVVERVVAEVQTEIEDGRE